MQLLKRSGKSSDSSPPRQLLLPTISDAQLAEIERRAKLGGHKLNRCPTCNAGHVKPVPSENLGFPTDSFYTDYQGNLQHCDCEWQDTLRRRYLLAGIPKDYWRLGEEDYYGDREAWNTAQDYLAHWDDYKAAGIGLEFYSPNQGTGKTFLLTYVSRQLIQRGERVHFTYFRDIMGLYQAPYSERKALEDPLRHSTVLALDEVGKSLSGAQGEYYASEFESLMRERIDSGRVTLMTTKMLPDVLDRFYPRTYSMLAARQKRWAIEGEDVRRAGTAFNILEQFALNKLTRPIQ